MATSSQVAALISYVGGRAGVDDTFAASKYDEADQLVRNYCGAEVFDVPEVVLSSQVLEVAAKLWARRGASNGATNYATIDGTPMPTPRDPMVTAYPVLDRFLSGGFA